jgi:hypothetical protein
MREAIKRLQSFAQAARMRNTKRMRVALVIAALVGLLVSRTWPPLQTGLWMLFLGYLGLAIALFLRNRQLGNLDANIADVAHWFDREQAFLRRSFLWETIVRSLGFLLLGYGFWQATHSVSISLLLGVGYPAFAYLSMDLRHRQRAIQNLLVEREALISLAQNNQ